MSSNRKAVEDNCYIGHLAQNLLKYIGSPSVQVILKAEYSDDKHQILFGMYVGVKSGHVE